MIIVANRNIIIPSTDGSKAYPVSRGYIGPVPDWVTDTDYFKALVKDGKIAVSETKKDKDIADAEQTEVLDRAQNRDAEPAEVPDEDAETAKKRTVRKSR
jgi:hypothetical protein|nr:MAG TPA: hypothetical protein [Caudoviricetes sp.]